MNEEDKKGKLKKEKMTKITVRQTRTARAVIWSEALKESSTRRLRYSHSA